MNHATTDVTAVASMRNHSEHEPSHAGLGPHEGHEASGKSRIQPGRFSHLRMSFALTSHW